MNDFLVSHNMNPLGLINPMLYLLNNQEHECINDINFGGNPGCGTAGFQATTGRDPVRALCIFSGSFLTFS